MREFEVGHVVEFSVGDEVINRKDPDSDVLTILKIYKNPAGKLVASCFERNPRYAMDIPMDWLEAV
jgi:hypothetical protein